MGLGMTQTSALQWEMYGPGTAVEFFALRDDEGFGLQVSCAGEMLLSDLAPDVPTLFRKSSQIRSQLAKLGFAGMPSSPGAPDLDGGVCWGPASLQSSLTEALGR